MGNKLSGEEPQHIKALKSKPNVLKEPALQYYTAGWRDGEFDDDAEEFSFATCTKPSGPDGDDDKEGPTDHRDDRHASKDDFKDFQIRRGGLEERSAPRQDDAWKARKSSPSEDRRVPAEEGQKTSDRYNGCRPKEVAAQQEVFMSQQDTSARNAVSETAGV